MKAIRSICAVIAAFSMIIGSQELHSQIVPYYVVGTGGFEAATGNFGGPSIGLHLGNFTYSGNAISVPDPLDPLLLHYTAVDVQVAADVRCGEVELLKLRQKDGLGWAVSDSRSANRQQRQTDNLLFHRQSTVEFVGKGDIFDLTTQLNLTSSEAAELSAFSPAWGEFHSWEGQSGGRIAH